MKKLAIFLPLILSIIVLGCGGGGGGVPGGLTTGATGATGGTATASTGGTTTGGAAAPVFSFPSGMGGQLLTPSFDAVEGNLFTVAGSTNVLVTDLGVEVTQSGQPAFTTGIFDSSGNVLASVSIPNSSPLSGGYYWQAITPITLNAGSQYYIGTLHFTGSTWAYIWNTRTPTVPSFIVDNGTYFKQSSTLAGGTWQYGGGTSQYGSGEIRHFLGNFKAKLVNH